MKKYILTALFAAILVNISAQVITRTTDSKTIDNSIKLGNKSVTTIQVLPKFDVDKLLAEDEAEKAAGLPFRFGYIFETNYSIKNSGQWTELSEGRVWALQIVSKGAFSINLTYDKFYLPKGSHLYVYNSDKTVLQGPITSEHNTLDGQFATDLIQGSAIILEYFEPNEVKEKGIISISKVVHGYVNLFSEPTKGFGSSASCNININCPQGQAWQAESNSVAMILVGDNRICSGALINNACQNFIPYFLTANHCIQNQNVANWTFRFGYKSPTCSGGDGYFYYSYFGSTLRASNADTDFALLELNQRPMGNTGITYAGWSRNPNAPNSSVGIHHPNGDVMKISIENNQATSIAWYEGPANTHWRVSFDQGIIQHGSSGSPLFDQNRLIVGQLHGNQNNICPLGNDFNCWCVTQIPIGEYGRFDVSWNNGLAAWLDPNGTNVMNTNTLAIPFLTGTNIICSTNQTFTLNNRPPGSLVTWTWSHNLIYVSGQGTNQLTVKGNSGGPLPTAVLFNNDYGSSGWVRATITTGVCDDLVLEKTIWVGKPAFTPIVTGSSNISCSRNMYREMNNRSVTWSVAGPLRIIGPNYGHKCIVEGTSSGIGWVYATVSNECGSFRGEMLVTVSCGYYTVSPNPASSQITISQIFNYNALGQAQQPKPITTIRLVDQMGVTMMTQNFQGAQTSVVLNISSLQKGIYLLKINETEGHTLIKE